MRARGVRKPLRRARSRSGWKWPGEAVFMAPQMLFVSLLERASTVPGRWGQCTDPRPRLCKPVNDLGDGDPGSRLRGAEAESSGRRLGLAPVGSQVAGPGRCADRERPQRRRSAGEFIPPGLHGEHLPASCLDPRSGFRDANRRARDGCQLRRLHARASGRRRTCDGRSWDSGERAAPGGTAKAG